MGQCIICSGGVNRVGCVTVKYVPCISANGACRCWGGFAVLLSPGGVGVGRGGGGVKDVRRSCNCARKDAMALVELILLLQRGT